MSPVRNYKSLGLVLCSESLPRKAASVTKRKISNGMRAGAAIFAALCAAVVFAGCGGYSSKPLYSQDIKSVYVEMFDNITFTRDLEYDLTDAVAKRIEAETPYKIVSDRSRADTVLSGKITGIGSLPLTLERETGRALENQAEVFASFSWKNLKTGEYLLENKEASATASYSEFQQQGFSYASKTATNKLAERIVEQMQTGW
ncbi:MAG: LptE family protein [Phycisphaerae bacterium]|nr:LptE family protein [Phycisphaerae bacterium]